jgi:hypothetical protein
MSAWTIEICGSEAEDGERGYLYCVDAASQEAAEKIAMIYHLHEGSGPDPIAKVTACYRSAPRGRDREDTWNDLRPNTYRAKRAAAVVASYPDHAGEDIETIVGDLIADLQHHVLQSGGDVERVMRVARDHFWCESRGEA